jgi:hypothetical protein
MMINFAEQTAGSGAVIVVWSFLIVTDTLQFTKKVYASLR